MIINVSADMRSLITKALNMVNFIWTKPLLLKFYTLECFLGYGSKILDPTTGVFVNYIPDNWANMENFSLRLDDGYTLEFNIRNQTHVNRCYLISNVSVFLLCIIMLIFA